jgi:TDG/mug DNA glycosylase family protein
MRLASVHHELGVGDHLDTTISSPDLSAVPLETLAIGAGFGVVEQRRIDAGAIGATLERVWTLPDTVGPKMRLLICGLNPSPAAADAGVGFDRPGNRFWPAALMAGLVTVDRDPLAAFESGIGMTDLVKRTTRTASELRATEYRSGLARVESLARWLTPSAICFVGLAGWRAAVDSTASVGPQAEPLGGRPVYVMGSTSGLNARVLVEEHAAHLRAAYELADL